MVHSHMFAVGGNASGAMFGRGNDKVRFVANANAISFFKFAFNEGVREMNDIRVLFDPTKFGQTFVTVVVFVTVHVQITLAGGDVGFAVGTDGVGAIGGLPLGGTDAHVVGTTRTCGAGRRSGGGVAVDVLVAGLSILP